ncbi:MAG: protease-4 [Halieaceae bacterium]|jgi:protease-4
MIGRFFKGLWRGITTLRRALANLLFIALLVLVYLVFSDQPAPLPERAALVLNPTGRVVDERTHVQLPQLLGADAASGEVLLQDLIDSVEFAREDERIVALVLDLDGLLSIGLSKTSELGAAIARFRDSAKPVVALGSYYSQDQYRLAVEADTVLMHPFGVVALEGFSIYQNYFADALEKLSVSMHVFRAGDFKSIAEPYMRTDMSPGERRVTQNWLDDLWRGYGRTVEARRGLESGALTALIDGYPQRLREQSGSASRLALQAGLVDELLDRDQQNEFLSELVGARDEDERYSAIVFEEYLSRVRPRRIDAGSAAVAIVTAQGSILPGEQPPGTIGADTLTRLLRETAQRSETRAIVLRINSGGGSVFASEIIREELARIRREGTPIVASFGAVAASGGYYIAMATDRIVATESTITGSIGVFAAFPTVERLLARGGVYTDGVGTTSLAGGLRPDRALAPAIADALQQSVDSIYEQFVDLVADGRGLDRAAVDAVAEGRVLSATAAHKAGLLDSIGGLDAAVDVAAELAGLEEGAYSVISIDTPVSPQQLLLQQLGEILGAGRPSVLGQLLPGGAVLQGWLQPLRENAELLETLEDPQHLYMHCLVCGS